MACQFALPRQPAYNSDTGSLFGPYSYKVRQNEPHPSLSPLPYGHHFNLLMRNTTGQHSTPLHMLLAQIPWNQWSIRWRMPGVFMGAFFLLVACQPDESPLRSEIATLKKQLTKQEAVIRALQGGSTVMQQQIDLLNGELREAQDNTKAAEAEGVSLSSTVQSLATQNDTLKKQVQWARAKSARITEAIKVKVHEQGAQSHDLPYPLSAASKATEAALAGNSYTLRVRANTGRMAVYVTDRKVSKPASLEVAGFRNQYVVSLYVLSSKGTRVKVNAEFEKTSQGGRIMPTTPEEKAEIERRLIEEIKKKLAIPVKLRS